MNFQVLFESHFFIFGVVPLLIFMCRVLDVSIGTMRLIFISRGYKLYAVCFGFIEIFIWLVAITQVMNNLTNIWYYFAYGSGFATGIYVGMIIEEKLALGNVLLRVITSDKPVELLDYLKENGFGYTKFDGKGTEGSVKMLFTILTRTDVESVVSFIRRNNPNAFYTIEDVRYINEHHFSLKKKRLRLFNRAARKGK